MLIPHAPYPSQSELFTFTTTHLLTTPFISPIYNIGYPVLNNCPIAPPLHLQAFLCGLRDWMVLELNWTGYLVRPPHHGGHFLPGKEHPYAAHIYFLPGWYCHLPLPTISVPLAVGLILATILLDIPVVPGDWH